MKSCFRPLFPNRTTRCLLAILPFCLHSVSFGQASFEQLEDIALEDVYNGSSSFADVDGDGDVDVLITGEIHESQRISKLYLNQGNTFAEVDGTSFPAITASSSAFSDVDGDGDTDLLLTGVMTSGRIARLYKNDGLGSFSLVSGTPFEGVAGGSIDFADIDNDGDEDVLITGDKTVAGQQITKLYRNDGIGNFTEEMDTPFLGVYQSDAAFADVDGDSDLDVLISGRSASGQRITRLYSNNGSGLFTEVSGTPFVLVVNSSVAFSDIDQDGDFDLIITGFSTQANSRLYINDGTGDFSAVSTSIEPVSSGAVTFSDVDNDGDDDLLLTGQNGSGSAVSKLYLNEGGIYNELSVPFEGVRLSSVSTSDIDQDGDLDVIMTGYTGSSPSTRLYRNDVIPPDEIPPVVEVNSLTTSETSPSLTGTIDDNSASIEVIVDENSYTASNNQDGTWTLASGIITPPLTEGVFDITVIATDLAGNVGMDQTQNELEIIFHPVLSVEKDQNRWIMYPNPSDGNVTLQGFFSKYGGLKLDIIERSGQVLKTFRLRETTQHVQLDLMDLPKGIYVLHIISSDGESIDHLTFIKNRP